MATRCNSFLLVLVLGFLFMASAAHAQLGLAGEEGALSIALSPRTPNPGDTVNPTVQGALIDIPESTILWQASGKTIAQGKGVESASFKAGALGTETRISVVVTTPEGTIASAQATIIPTELDLLVDSDSYTPPFYQGGVRASVGTNLRLQALPRFKRGGVSVPAATLTYTWRRNGEILRNSSGLGKSAASIPVQHLFGSDTVSVEAQSADGLLAHTASLSFSASEPILMLYEDHPRYGVLFHRALSPSAFISETEMTFAAVPFFFQATRPSDPALNFAWRVNSATIPTNAENPSELTIDAENSSGIALVELELTHASNYYLDLKGTWNITFSSEAGSTDQFHAATQ